MANKEALRELQGRLAERLQEVQSADHTSGWLAVESGGHGFLLPLAEAGEIFQPGQLLPVPHTQNWFLGVANLRGALTGVADLAGFLGLRDRVPAAVREQGRVVAFNPSLGINAGLLVDRLAGLRNPEHLSPEPLTGQAHPEFVEGTCRDDGGRLWQVLRLALLARDERFLRIVAPA
jgi:twitching motility protein PilI